MCTADRTVGADLKATSVALRFLLPHFVSVPHKAVFCPTCSWMQPLPKPSWAIFFVMYCGVGPTEFNRVQGCIQSGAVVVQPVIVLMQHRSHSQVHHVM